MQPSRIQSHTAWVTRRTLSTVKSSAMMPRQPSVPNLILERWMSPREGSRATTLAMIPPSPTTEPGCTSAPAAPRLDHRAAPDDRVLDHRARADAAARADRRDAPDAHVLGDLGVMID